MLEVRRSVAGGADRYVLLRACPRIVTLTDMPRYLVRDEDVGVIVAAVEAEQNPERFRHARFCASPPTATVTCCW